MILRVNHLTIVIADPDHALHVARALARRGHAVQIGPQLITNGVKP